MIFSPNGQRLMEGVGDGRIRIDGSVPAALANLEAGGWTWLLNSVIAGNALFEGAWGLTQCDLSTGVVSRLDRGGLGDQGCTNIYSDSCGRWLVYLANAVGSYDSEGHHWPDRVAKGMSPEGDQIFSDRNNNGLTIRHADGSEGTYAVGPVLSVQMAAGVILYQGPDALHAIGAPDPVTPTGGAIALFTEAQDGSRWLCSWVEAVHATVVYPWQTSGDLIGYALSHDEQDFDPTIAVRTSDGMLVVGTGLNQGEVGQRLYEIDRGNGVFRRDGGPWTPLEPIDLSTPKVTFQFDHPVLVAPFKDLDGSSGAPAEVVVNQMQQVIARRCFAPMDSLAGVLPASPFDGIYTEDDKDNLAALLAEAQRRKTRIIWTHDGPDEPHVPSWLPVGGQPWIECYLVKGETLDQSAARWMRDILAALAQWPGDLGLVPMFYLPPNPDGSSMWTIAQVLAALARLSDLVNLDPRIKIIAPFEYTRANGIIAHPELRAAFGALLAAAARAGIPTFEAPAFSDPAPPAPTPISPTPVPPAGDDNMQIGNYDVEQDGDGIKVTALAGGNTGTSGFTEAQYPNYNTGLLQLQAARRAAGFGTNDNIDAWRLIAIHDLDAVAALAQLTAEIATAKAEGRSL